MRVSNQWVVDASVALKWYFRDEEFLPQADSLLEAFSSGAAILTAPSFIRYEVANALIVANRRGRISQDQLLERLQSFLALHISQPLDDEETLHLAVQLTGQVPVAFYDALLGCQRLWKKELSHSEKYHKWPNYEVLAILSNDEDGVFGFNVHFSNGSKATFSRSKEGLDATNIKFEEDGSINFWVGMIDELESSAAQFEAHQESVV